MKLTRNPFVHALALAQSATSNLPAGMRRKFPNSFVATFTLTLALISNSQAVTRTWDGSGANDDWSTISNWDNNLLPENTADVVFGTGFTSGTSIDLIAARIVNSLTINTLTAFTIIGGDNLTLTSGQLARNDIAGTELNHSITAAVILGANGAFNINGSGTLTLDGAISDGASSFSLTKSGNGVLILSGAAESYNGDTTVSGGILRLGADNQITNGTGFGNLVVNSGGTFDLAGFSDTINGLSGDGIVDKSTASTETLTLGDGNATANFSGTIVNTLGTINLTKTGTGTQTLSGNNNYAGLTTVSDGILAYGIGNALGSGAVTVNGAAAELSIGTFSDTVGAVTLTNGSITGTSGVLTGTSYAMQSGSVSAILGGTGALTKTTAGTVTLSGVNTHTGITTISAGILSVATIGDGGVASNLGAAAVSAANLVIGNGTLQYTGATASTNRAFTITAAQTATFDITTNNLTVSGASAATTGALTKIGTGTLILSGANGYTGLTTVTGGTLAYGVNDALSSGAVTVNGGTLDIKTFSDSVGAVTLTSGSIDGTTGVLTGTSYALNGTVNTSVSAILGGAVALTKSNTGTATLSGVNTYTGITTISGGTLSVATIGNGGVAGNLGAAAVAATNLVIGNGTLQYTGATASTNRAFTITAGQTATFDITTNDLTISGAGANTTGALDKIGAGKLILSGANLFTGQTDVQAGTLEYGVANALSNGAVVVSGGILDIKTFSDSVGAVTLTSGSIAGTTGVLTGTSYTLNGTVATGVSAILGGAVALTKSNAGTATLSGANTYTGITTISGGTLSVATIGNGGVAGNLGAAAVAAANLVIGNGTLQYTGATASTNRAFTITAGQTATFDITTNDLTVSGASAVTTGALTKTGAGSLILSGANGYTGLTTVTNGTLAYGVNDALSSGGVTVNGGILDIKTFSDSVGAVTLTSGSINGTTGVLTGTSYALNGTVNTSVSAILGGAVALTKSNAGTATLSGVNTYTGLTTVSGGTLAYGVNNALSSGAVTVNGGILDIGTFSDTVGAITLSSGSITGSTGVLTGTSYSLTDSGSVSAILAGAVTLTKTGAGTATLSGANTYTGLTDVQVGTLALGASDVFANASTLKISGGVLSLVANSDTVVGVQLTAGSITGSGTLTSTTAFDLQAGTISAILGGSIGANKTTAGTVTLSGGNTYTGLTDVQAGTLALGASNVFADASTLKVSGGILSLLTFSDTVAGVQLTAGSITGSGTLTSTAAFDLQAGTVSAILGGSAGATKTTAGTVTLSGVNTYTGLTDVQAGTLALGVANVFADASTLKVSGGTLSMLTFADTVAGVQLTGGSITGSTGVLTSTTAFDLQAGSIGADLGGSAGAIKTAAGTVTLSGGNTYTGITDVQAGTLALGASGVFADASTLKVSGGTLGLATFNDTVAGVQLTGGSITGTGTLTSTTAFDLQAGSVGAILGGSAGANKTTGGTVTLSGGNTYTGLTDVQAGTLALGASNVFADTSTLKVSGGILSLLTFSDTVAGVQLTGGSITGTGTLTSTTAFDLQAGSVGAILGGTAGANKTTAGTVTLSSANSYTGLTTVSAGTLQYGSSNALSSGGVTVNGGILDIGTFSDSVGAVTLTSGSIVGTTGVLTGTSYALNGTVNTSVSAILGGGAVALTKSNAGTATLSGLNTYTGLTTVSGGTLAYGVSNAISSGAVTVSGGILNIGTFSDSVAAVTLTSGSIDGTTGVLTGASYAMQSGSVSAILGGTGIALNKTTAGTVTLSGENTYTGITTISGGTLSVATIGNGGVAGNLGAATVAATNLVIGNGTLQYTGAAASTNRAFTITAAQTAVFDITTNDLTISGAGANTTGALDKIGAGKLILSGANLFTGQTDVQAGTLEYGVNNALSNGAVVVSSGTLDIKTFTDSVGAVTLSSGSITGTSGVLTGTSYALTNTGSVSAILAGAAVNLTKTGAGTATISGNNTYTGVTSVTGGTLRATTSANALGTGAATLDMGGGTLELANDTGLAFNRNTTLSATSTIESDRQTSGSGVTHTLGALALTAGTLNITAGSNVTSGTAGLTFDAVTSGDNANVIAPGAGTLVTVASMGTGANRAFTINGAGDMTVNGAVQLGNRNLIKSGTGTLTLSGASTSTSSNDLGAGRNWQVNGGVLKLDNLTALAGGITSSASGGAGLTINGGVVGLANGNFSRVLGPSTAAGANQVEFTGSGGFAAYTADRNVNLGGASATVTWNAGSFVPTGSALILGASNADKTVTFQNPIALAGAARTVQVNNGSAAVDAILSGALTGTTTSGLTKTGTGTLGINNTGNTYTGTTTVSAGTLLANNASGSATGTGAVSVASGAILGGSGTILPTGTNGINVSGALAPGAEVSTIGTLTLDLGSTSGTVVMNSGASFQYDLGAAGIDINTLGTSDLLTIAGAAAADTLTFNGNSINFGGTGTIGYYKLFDSVRDNTNTWSGPGVVDSITGLIPASWLSVANLTSGLSGNLIMGGVGSLGGAGTTGDIYLQVIPEPSAALLAGIGSLLLLRRRRVA